MSAVQVGLKLHNLYSQTQRQIDTISIAAAQDYLRGSQKWSGKAGLSEAEALSGFDLTASSLARVKCRKIHLELDDTLRLNQVNLW